MSVDYTRFLNPAIAAAPKSGIRKFFDIVQTMPGAISLGVGEPDFVTPYHIRERAINSLLDGETAYTGNWGIPSLREEIAKYLESRYRLAFSPKNEILCTVGASEGIDLTLRALLSPGDEALVPEPSYVSYQPNVIFAGGSPKPIPTRAENGFALEPIALERAITEKTKLLILPYPNNPTGAILPRETLEAIRDIVVKRDLMVLSDEIYSELTYGSERHASIGAMEGMRERTVVVNGFSKAFAMTGWRMGYVCGPAPVLDVMVKIHQYTIMCANRQSQVAAEEALRRGREDGYQDVETMRQSYNQRRRLMVAGFRDMGLSCFEPLGAFYVFPSIAKTGLDSETFCNRLLREQKVVCVPGTAFGRSGEGHVRCCYATSLPLIEEALRRIAAFLATL